MTITVADAAAIDFGVGAASGSTLNGYSVDDYLKVSLAAFTTWPKLLMSASIRFLKASPVGPPGVTAIFFKPSCTPGSASALPSSAVSLATTGAGVPAGTKK